MRQTAPQIDSPIEGKKQNCDSFGTYEPSLATTDTVKLCHGGWYKSKWYEPCPVREECRIRTSHKGLPVINNGTRQASGIFELPRFRAPNLGRLPTQQGQVRSPEVQEQIKAKVAEAFEAAMQQADGQTPTVVMPDPGAPPGLRTPFVASQDGIGMSPTFVPSEGQSTLERLFMNILQGIIAAIGYQIWSFARSIDLFA